MKRKYLVMIIIVLFFLLIWFSNREKNLDYDDYEKMEVLSQKSTIELEKEGYSDIDIRKIKEFNINYENHLILLDMIESNNLKNYGYNNRNIDSEYRDNIIYDENCFSIKENGLSHTTTAVDFVKEEKLDRDVARTVMEFEWDIKPVNNEQYISIKYPNYIPEDIYTCLKYENLNDKNDVVYKMAEIMPYNFIDEFYTDITSKKTINQQDYILKSGVIVLDIRSYYLSGVAPLSIISQYKEKSFLGKEKVLSEQHILNVENNNVQ